MKLPPLFVVLWCDKGSFCIPDTIQRKLIFKSEVNVNAECKGSGIQEGKS